MNKIEELRKRVRLTPEEIQQACILGGQQYMVAVQHNVNIPSLDMCCKSAITEAQLNKVLNDPDLRLIGRDKSLFTVMLDVNSNAYYPATPLAEALKEVKNE